jgi:hypothetical protein
MPESLATADGKVIDLEAEGEREFARAMAAPEADADQAPDYPPPRKRRNPDAPFGLGDDGKPKAPYGFGVNGKPRQNLPGPGRGGKQAAKADKPRVQAATKAVAPDLPAKDYSADLAETIDGFWVGLAFLPPTQAQATILKANRNGLVAGLNLSAQHNPYVRRGIEYFCGEAAWMVNAAMMIAPFAIQSAALWFKPDSLKNLGTSKEELAEIAQADFKAYVEEKEKALAELVAAQPAVEVFAPGTGVAVPQSAVVLYGQSKDATKPAQVVIDTNGTGAHTPATSSLLEVQGQIAYSGSNSAGSAPSPGIAFANGTAAQMPDLTRDFMVYFQIGTAGTGFSVKIGSGNPPGRTVYASATPPAGGLVSFRVPAGWFVQWAGTGTTLASQTCVGC